MGKLSIRLFGRLGVTDGDGGKISVAGKKPQALLAYLALNVGQPQSRDKLAALLWGERFDEQARQSLRQGISKLRKALADGDPKVLVIDGDDVGLNTDAADIDAVEFERLASEGTPAALNEAAGLYVGGLLEGLEVKEKGFEDWVGTERSRFADIAADVLAKLSCHQADAGDTDAAIETAKRLTTVDPLSEEGHRTLMRLYADNGKRAQALKQFKTLEAALQSELNAEPEPKTRSLYEEIQSNESPEPASGKSDPAAAAKAISDKPSIAVLAFDNMSGDPEQEYFSDGITEDIITALSNVHSFLVIARNSSFTYKGRPVDIKTVGRELGVHYVLEGSVRRSGDRVRVSAQLVEAATAANVWADRFEGTLDDIFDLQDQVSASVVGAIEPELLRAEAERIKQKRPESLDAYDCTLRGLSLMNRLTPETTAEALRLFLKATEIDPGFGRAYVCASWCHRRNVQLNGMVLSEEEQRESLRLAEQAIGTDATDPYILWQAGLTFALVEGDIDRASRLIEQSLTINSNSTRGWIASGMIRNCLGNPEAAIEAAKRGIRLSPLETAMWVAHGVLAIAHFQLGEYDEATQWARFSVEKHRYNLPAYHVLVAALAELGQTDEANIWLDRLLELDPETTISRLQAIYPISRYRNLDEFLEGLRKTGVPEE